MTITDHAKAVYVSVALWATKWAFAIISLGTFLDFAAITVGIYPAGDDRHLTSAFVAALAFLCFHISDCVHTAHRRNPALSHGASEDQSAPVGTAGLTAVTLPETRDRPPITTTVHMTNPLVIGDSDALPRVYGFGHFNVRASYPWNDPWYVAHYLNVQWDVSGGQSYGFLVEHIECELHEMCHWAATYEENVAALQNNHTAMWNPILRRELAYVGSPHRECAPPWEGE